MKLNSLLFAQKPDSKGKNKAPFIFISTIYFAEGLPWVLVNLVSVPMYAKFGIPNTIIGLFTSLLALPWIIKMFWGPVVDRYSTKRTWLLSMQLLCAVLFAAVAAFLGTESFFVLTIITFFLIAFVSATHDIAIDGFYMLSLTRKQQAFFVGIRSLFYRIAIIFGTGVLIFIVGKIETDFSITSSWISAFVLCALLFLCLSLFHYWYLPYPGSDTYRNEYSRNAHADTFTYSSILNHYREIFGTFFTQKKIIPILAFILLYRFGEAQLTKMVPPFLLNPADKGGLGISTEDYGLIQGIVGSSSLIFGGIAGGWTIAKYGLRKCIWPMAIALNVPNLLYVYISIVKPALSVVAVAIAVEQFGYGIGFSAYMMFLIYISKGEFKTSLYAIATGIMALGLMLPGMISGYIQQWLGYQNFFIVATLLTIPGMLSIFFIPIEENND